MYFYCVDYFLLKAKSIWLWRKFKNLEERFIFLLKLKYHVSLNKLGPSLPGLGIWTSVSLQCSRGDMARLIVETEVLNQFSRKQLFNFVFLTTKEMWYPVILLPVFHLRKIKWHLCTSQKHNFYHVFRGYRNGLV